MNTLQKALQEYLAMRRALDPGVILFGLTFCTKDQVLLNTIHVAPLGKAFTSEIDPDLTVRTFPISHKRVE